jgi:hypothetical protein
VSRFGIEARACWIGLTSQAAIWRAARKVHHKAPLSRCPYLYRNVLGPERVAAMLEYVVSRQKYFWSAAVYV